MFYSISIPENVSLNFQHTNFRNEATLVVIVCQVFVLFYFLVLMKKKEKETEKEGR
jgi:hypothetical protein